MSQENIELMKKANDLLNKGDMESFLELHAPDVAMHVTGRNATSGDFKGREGVASVFQQLMGLLDGPPSFETHDILASDDHVVVLGTQTATRGGKTLTSDAYVTAHVKDGKFTEVWVTPIDPYREDEFLA